MIAAHPLPLFIPFFPLPYIFTSPPRLSVHEFHGGDLSDHLVAAVAVGSFQNRTGKRIVRLSPVTPKRLLPKTLSLLPLSFPNFILMKRTGFSIVLMQNDYFFKKGDIPGVALRSLCCYCRCGVDMHLAKIIMIHPQQSQLCYYLSLYSLLPRQSLFS